MSKEKEVLLWEDLGLQKRNGRLCCVSVYKGLELLTDYEEALASGSVIKFRWDHDSLHMTQKDLWELDAWLTQGNNDVTNGAN